MRKTKIICTLGPASSDEAVLTQMLQSGMNVARLNFSHGTHPEHAKTIQLFRRVRDQLGLPAAVMLDTKGPEIRLKNFQHGKILLEEGKPFTLTTEEFLGDETKASITFQDLPAQLKPGHIACTVLQGGFVSDHKGINVPGVHIDMPYLSQQDKQDLLFGIQHDVDFVAASFVRSYDDVREMRKFLDYNGGHDIRIIAKIENLEGIENFDEILRHSNGIMVARGDMGVEVEYERLPGLQKKFIHRCYQSGKVVITATQMLESMIQNPNPTRAEITDVANAVFDGTSAVMLSGESAMGKYPVKAVQVMARIAEQAESDAFSMDVYRGIQHEMDCTDTTNAICDATCTTARDLNAKAIIAVTKFGHTARRMSKFRPFEPIVAATPVEKTFHQLSLSWGVYPVLARYQRTTDDLFLHAVDCAKQLDLVTRGDRVVITAGVPLSSSGSTNILKVEVVDQKI